MNTYCVLFLLLGFAVFICHGERRLTPYDWNSSKPSQIVRGKEAEKYEYPFIVLVESQGKQICGGTIITAWHVLTAAHCTHQTSISDLSIRLGVHDLEEDEGYTYYISKNYIHRKYNEKTLTNDIALLATTSRMKFNEYVQPACLPSKKLHLNGQRVKALGWGNTRNTGFPSNILKEVDLQVVPFSKCTKSWKSSKFLLPKYTTLCTFESRKDTCQGDSGGPLVRLEADQYILVGVVSYGDKCAGSIPSINTYIYPYIKWIETIIQGPKHKGRMCMV